MNQQHPIDDLFRRHLTNSSVQPPSYVWERIMQERRRRRQRRIWMWGAPLSLVASLVLAVILWDNSPELGSFAIATTSAPTAEGASDNILSTEAGLPGSMSSAPEQEISMLAAADVAPAGPTASPRNRTTINKNGNARVLLSQPQGELYSNARDRETLLPLRPQAETQTTRLEGKESLLSRSVEAAEENRIAGPHQRERIVPVALLPTNTIAPRESRDLSLFNSSHAPRCARFADQFLNLDVEVLGGPAYAHQQLQSRTVEGVSHLRDRQQTEHAGWSFSSGIRLAATSNSGLGLRTGLMYTQINDHFEHFLGTTVDTIINYHYDPNGNIISSDTTWSSKDLMADKNNTLRFVEVPLLLTFERQWGKFRVAVNGGAYLNILFDAEGEVLSPATREPAPFGQTGDADVLPIFNQRATAAWYGSATLVYNLHSRYSLLIEPYIKSYPRALTNPDYDLQQNYWLAGLQAGVRMRL